MFCRLLKNPLVSAALFLAAAVSASAAPERGFTSKAPAATWEQALVSGNGIHGAMVFGVPHDETVIINHGRLYMPLHKPLPPPDTASILPEIRRHMADGEFQKAADMVVELANKNGYRGKHWTDPFIPACDLKIRMDHQGTMRNYERSVDFATGMASVAWDDDRGRFIRKLFVSRTDDVIVMSIRGPKPGTVDCELALDTRPGGNSPYFKQGIKDIVKSAAEGVLNYRMGFTNAYEGGIHACEVTAKVIAKGGRSAVKDAAIAVEGADEMLVLLRVGLPKNPGESTAATTAEALAKLPADFDQLLAPHAKQHGEIFLRSKLDLKGGQGRELPSEELIASSKAGATNPALLEKIYDAARYNILSSSGTLMPNLQGIWTGTWSSPWSGDFTMNGNLQTAMAGNLSGNMAECLEPYWRFLEENMPAFRENAKRLYGTRGIHVPSRASTHGYNNHFCATWPMTFWTAGAPWAAQFMYDYWQYTGDDDFLRQRALPFMKEAAVFYEDFLIPGPDGCLLFSPSYSPENEPSNSRSQSCINATMDISAAKELFVNLIAACRYLGVESEGVARWTKLLEKMPPYQINADGALKEWTTPLLEDNYAHRHCSHLYAIYQGLPDEIAGDAKLKEAFRVALDKRLEVRRQEAKGISLNGRKAGEMAFGLCLEAMAAASLRQADECALIVEWLANTYWGPNLVSTHDPGRFFNTDISGGLPHVIHRMLVDSRPGHIELLPAVPADWHEGRIEGIRARGNIEIRSLAWTRDNVSAAIVSPINQTLKLHVRGERSPRSLQLSAGVPLVIDAKAAAPFDSSWESLRKYECPEWFRDAKFGIWSHWGPQAVPMQGDWYARHMYHQGHRQYEHHRKTYGHPSEHGYKDIIRLWKAEKWDPDGLMALYQKAGARYFVSMACHHDNFDLWNSKHHSWNAVKMGPKRDIVGDWQKAAKKHGLRFGVSEHMAASFTWWQANRGSDKTGPKAGVPYDGANPEFEDLYHPAAAPDDKGWYSTHPAWHAEWNLRVRDLLDQYRPDLLYSDGGLPFGATGRQLVADFYNASAARNGGRTDVVYNCKSLHGNTENNQFVAESCVWDMERGVLDGIQPRPWQTDTSIGDWYYNEHWEYRPTSWTVHMLVDIVSKNGNLLLNVVQRPDGSLDPEVEQQLDELAGWMAVHSEAIHGTRPWQVFGEGRVKAQGGNFNENFTYSDKDIRFTTKGKTLYAIALGWPENGRMLVRSLAKSPDAGVNRITAVSLLGYDGGLRWEQTGDGLEVILPAKPVSLLTTALRIEGTDLQAMPVGSEVPARLKK